MSGLGLTRSKLFHVESNFPRILWPILDLIGKDPEWSKCNFTMQSLLENSIESDSRLNNQLRPHFGKHQDIVTGLQDYYSWVNLSFGEYTKKEDLLLQILSNYLQRKIIFHPILKPTYVEQLGKTFGDNFEAVFHIFGYRYHAQSYYISARNQ